MPIEIEQTQTVENKSILEPNPDENMEPEAEKIEPEFNPELEHELQIKLQPILLESAINALGNTLEKITSNQDMNFTPDEHKALVDSWTPLLPSVSPMTNAVLVTIIILSGKGLLYAAGKKKNKLIDESKELPLDDNELKEAVS